MNGQKKFIKAFAILITLSLTNISNAGIISLTNQCSTGDSINGISTFDVSGNAGGASDCWGTFDGNDGKSGDLITDGITSWEFISKKNIGGEIEGLDIGLNIPVNNGTSGTWEFDPNNEFDSFVIVLKAANKPGWAAYLFEENDAESYFGEWSIAWGKDLSHFSVYANSSNSDIPEPFFLAVLGIGLVFIWRFTKKPLTS